MKIRLNNDTVESVNKYKLWDPKRSHRFVSMYQLNATIEDCVQSILESQSSLNSKSRNRSIFELCGCLSSFDALYEAVIQHPTMSKDQKMCTIDDSLTVIADDLNSRILIYNRYKDSRDLENYNYNTLQIMNTVSLGRNDSIRDCIYDVELASLFGVTTDVGKFKMDKMQHICSAMNSLCWGVYNDRRHTDELRLCDFIADIIFDIEGVFPNVLKDDDSDLFSMFVDAIEDILGFSYASINYYVGEDNTEAINKLDLLILKLHQFLRNVILHDRCSNVYTSAFDEYIIIRESIMSELGLTSTDFVERDPSNQVFREYCELLYNVAVSLVFEALDQIWSLYIESDGETDCFTSTICKKVTLMTTYLMTDDLTYLNYMSEV